MLARFIKTPETFDHLHMGIPANQYHWFKQALLVRRLDLLITKLDPSLLGEDSSDANHSKPPNYISIV